MNYPLRSRTLRWVVGVVVALVPIRTVVGQSSTDWPCFRGQGAQGVAEGFSVRTKWNADPQLGETEGILWETVVPGLGHSSPVISGNRIFLLTAVAEGHEAPLQVDAGGSPKAADDNGVQSWLVLCYDKNTGTELWRRVAYHGKPKATRHAKATHANTSACVHGQYLVAFFGSEGIYCYDLEGKLRWKRDLGVIDISKYGVGWGFSSSPMIHDDRIAIVCDDPSAPYIAVLRLDNGKDVWRVSREGVSERSWGTPLIHQVGKREAQVVVNGWPWIVSYDFETGKERWRLPGGGDNPIPTPFVAGGYIYVTNAHGGKSPIYAIRPEAAGDLSQQATAGGQDSIAWSVPRGGAYMSTPVVYRDFLYLGNSNGVLRCYDALSGDAVYQERLGPGAGVIASLVAADDKIFCASENGIVYVVQPGSEFRLLAENSMSEPCFATPALSAGVLYIRTTKRLVAIK